MMSHMNLSIDIYDILERKLGREDAREVAKAIETAVDHVEERSREISLVRKIEAKDELKRELKDELATKEDIAKLDKKFTVLFVVAIFSTLFVNKDALTWFAHIIGLIR